MNLTDKELNKLQEILDEKYNFIEHIQKVSYNKAIKKHETLNWFQRIFTSPIPISIITASSIYYCWKISKLQTEIEELKSK